MTRGWHPGIGAWCGADGASFRVWAPTTRAVTLVVEPAGGEGSRRSLSPEPEGFFSGVFSDLGAGTRYRYELDGDGPFPDPASRFQPDGVHGPSVVVDGGRFAWSDGGWSGTALESLVIYELHVGTFTPDGTFEGAADRLAYLKDLGVTAVELMPVADFPGSRNWGYDGAALFAPARCYGTPDDLRRLVDRAHALGLAVLLDVVYNHAGPDGAYLSRFSPYYFTDRHASPWGAGIDLDGPHSAPVRGFFIENALHWLHEYHVDGLRLDATHAIEDTSPTHFLAELADRARESLPGRRVHLIAEDHRNLAVMVRPRQAGGWGLDAVWADDFHHQMRRLLAGDTDGYYRDFSGTTADLAATIRQGWFFTGQYSEHLGQPRGTDPSGLAPSRFVVCLQNHDQVGNRALGDRLNTGIALAAFRAASVLLLSVPETPLLFMGQEWAASTPFQYFTDHHAELGRLVTEGRRREFQTFAAFADPAARDRIPDPQAPETFDASRLKWSEAEHEPHRSTFRLYAALLDMRRRECASGVGTCAAHAVDEDSIAVLRELPDGTSLLILVRLRGSGEVHLGGHPELQNVITSRRWERLLTSEDEGLSPDPAPPEIQWSAGRLNLSFARPGAVVLKAGADPGSSLPDSA